MSAKMAVSSSITWLIGWMRPRVSGPSRDGERDVDPLGGEPRVEGGLGQGLAPGEDRALHPVAQAVDERPLLPALLRRHRAEGLQQLGDAALLAERRQAHGFERRLVRGAGDLRQEVAFEGGEIGHRSRRG